MHWICRLALAPALLATATGAAQACGPRAEVTFLEGATDSFTIVNRSPAGWEIVEVALDLSGSIGGLYFDPTGGGPGVSMADPLQPLGGAARLTGASAVADGDTVLRLGFESFGAGASYVFTIDVDDRGGTMQAVVEPGEFAGARLAVRFATGAQEAAGEGLFDGDGRAATLDRSACS